MIEQSPESACICKTYCQDNREADLAPGDSLCRYCQTIDVYDPCPVTGYGCWPSCGDQDDPCCTPEQRAATAQLWVTTPPVKCDACGDTGRVPWMVEADPNLYQEPDADGTIPCPDCSPASTAGGRDE